MSIKGTQTEKNLLKAFAGESQARNRYTMFAEIAKAEGYEQIAAFFLETADQEKEHARIFYNHLAGGMVEITASYPAGDRESTLENLAYAADGEQEEHEELYPEFARIAKEEGFLKVASSFNLIAKIEAEHEARYRKLYKNLKEDLVFEDGDEIVWVCRQCGHIHRSKKAPGACPVCLKPQGFFERKQSNY